MPQSPKTTNAIRIACAGADTLPIEQLSEYQGNLKTLSKKNYQKLRKEILDLGFSEPITVWKNNGNNYIIGGHQRVRTLRQMVLDEKMECPPIPVNWVEARDEAEAKRKVLSLTSQYGEITGEGLYEFMNSFEGGGMPLEEIKESFRFPEIDFRSFEAEFFEKPAEEDGMQRKPTTGRVAFGELWKLGNHYLFCGDSTDPEAIKRICYNRKPFMMVTDPPYGVDYVPGWRNEKFGGSVRRDYLVAGDEEGAWTKVWKLFSGDVVYIWHSHIYGLEIFMELESLGFEIRTQIIWKKQTSVISQGHYSWQHEAAWYGVRKGKTSKWCGDRKQSTVWDIPNLNPFGGSEEKQEAHAAQKPIECMARPIRNHGAKGDYILDPFLGSGTTLIACQQLDRKCLGIEIDPLWCETIIQRFEKLTGEKAEKV